MKKCTKCLIEKPESEFHRNSKATDGLMWQCKDCSAARSVALRAQPDQAKGLLIECRDCGEVKPRYQAGKRRCRECSLARMRTPQGKKAARRNLLKSKYNITPEQYDAQLEVQGGHCATCEYTPLENGVLCVDHDKSCCPGKRSCGKCIRGLLCKPCNHAEGLLKDKGPHVPIRLVTYQYCDKAITEAQYAKAIEEMDRAKETLHQAYVRGLTAPVKQAA